MGFHRSGRASRTAPAIARAARATSLAVVATLALTGCSGEERPAAFDSVTGFGTNVADPSATCTSPSDGCPCPDDGAEVECGSVVGQTTTTVTCSIGKRTCRLGVWSSCEGAYVAQRAVTSLKPMGFGSTPTPCKTACDPGCLNISDTATSDLDAGLESGVAVSGDGGLRLSPGTSDGGIACTTLALAPATSTLTVSAISATGIPTTTPASLHFTPSLTPAACFTGTPPAAFTLSRYDTATIATTGDLALFASVAGDMTVTAFTGRLSATANVHVVVNARERGGTITATTAGTMYDGTGSATNGTSRPVDVMKILYPYADVAATKPTVLPLGLAAPIAQWATGGTAAAAVKISLRYVRGTETVFDWSTVVPESTIELERVPGANASTTVAINSQGPAYRIPQNVWAAFENTARGGDAVIGIQRLVNTTLQREKTIPIRFANGQLKGTVFYQSYGTRLALNYTTANTTLSGNPDKRFGAATLAIRPGNSTPSLIAGGSTASANTSDASQCFVCHTVAANGSKLITTYQDGSSGNYARFRVDLGLNASGQATSTTPALLGTNSDASPWAWGGISPDGKLIFNSSSGKSGDRDGVSSELWTFPATGAPTKLVASGANGLPSGLKGALPGWAPNGKAIAFTGRAGLTGSTGRDLGAIDFDPATNKFTNARILHVSPAPATGKAYAAGVSTYSNNSVWPSWTPDSTRVVFERELVSNGRDYAGTRSECESDTDCASAGQNNNQGARGELWLVRNAQNSASAATNPATSVRLESANGRKCDGSATCAAYVSYLPADTTTAHDRDWELQYEPTVNPVEAGGYQWIVMVSRRSYGNIATINPFWSDPRWKDISTRPTTKKLWVAALDPATGTVSTDPSYPAFYLPGQELMAGNTRGYWVQDACGAVNASCNTNDDCCGGTGATPTAACRIVTTTPLARKCQSLTTSACVADGQACGTSADCCGVLVGSQCAPTTGSADATLKCQAPPPLVTYPDATFVRDFEAVCPAAQKPKWTSFDWRAETPGDSFIEFDATSADRIVDFTGKPLVTIGRVPDKNGVNAYPAWMSALVKDPFAAASISPLHFLRVRMHLGASSDRKKTPVLYEWRAKYDCIAAE